MRKHLQLKINQLASKYADGSLSPRRVCRDALDDAVKLKTLNAFVRLTPEVAVQQAEESACRYQEEKQLGPMDGVPIAIKDNFCTRGIHTTCASKMLEDFVPPYNATVYERLLSAGAVLIGKTNMDEFAMGTGTVDSIFGPTKNVWSEDLSKDKWRISGGSSGGSATAVAAGICFAAIGSDTGGSTRNPASYCGIIGLKPTYGLVSRLGLIPLVNSMDVAGIFTRSVDDCVTVLNVIAGPDDKDSTTYHHPHQRIDLPEFDQIDISKIRVGIPKEYQCKELSAEVLEIWQQVADMLESEGAQVRQVSLPHTEYCVGVYSVLNCGEVASNMARYDGIEYGHRANVNTSFQELVAKTQEEGFNQVVKDRIALGNFFLQRENYDRYYDKAMRVRRLILEDYQKVFTPAAEQDRVDVLLTPTTLSDAPLYKDFIAISSVDQCEVQDYCTIPANLAGVPAISLPIRLSKSGLPLSLQLISKSLNEKMLLTVCKWIEAKVEFNFLKNNQIVERANREDVA